MRGIALSPQLFISFRHAGVDVMSRVEGHEEVRGGGAKREPYLNDRARFRTMKDYY